MRVKLFLVRSHVPQLPTGSVREFETSFTIGRGSTDWVLPDDKKRVSRHHADVFIAAGRVTLRNMSDNGTLVNGTVVTRENVIDLATGDTIGIGPYEFSVEFMADGPEIEFPGFGGLGGQIDPFNSASQGVDRKFPGNDFGPFDPIALLQERGGLSAAESPFPNRAPGIGPATPPDPDRAAGLGLHFRPQGAFTPPPEISSGAPPPFPEEFEIPGFGPDLKTANSTPDAAWRTFLEAAGVRPEDLGPGLDPQAQLALAGQLFRALVDGLVDLLQIRAKVKAEFRINQTYVAQTENSPFKFSANAQSVIFHLLGRPPPGFMTPEQAVSEAMRDVREHELAMLTAMNTALKSLVQRFDPEALARETQPHIPSGGLPFLSRSGRLWQAYCAFYAERIRDVDEHFEELWGREFNRAYERLNSATNRSATRQIETPDLLSPGGRRQ